MHKRIIAVHLLNDLSGSPLVFRQALMQLQKDGAEIHLFTATPTGKGWLSDMEGISCHPIFYRWHRNKIMTLAFFIICQCALFFRLLRFCNSRDILYANTILPFGAALAGHLRRCTVIYHFHEISVRPALLKNFLLMVANTCADRGIFVSRHLRNSTSFQRPSHVVYNALSNSFEQKAAQGRKDTYRPFNVLMLCSLKKYKGVDQFITLAERSPGIGFTLVLNAEEKDLQAYFGQRRMPANLELHTATQDVHPFYEKASLVVNLSLPDQWVETFGMTILEAMHYGKPVIIPPVGGITELVDPGQEGYRVDSRDLQALEQTLLSIWENKGHYDQLSANALQKAGAFHSGTFAENIRRVFQPAEPLEQPPGTQFRFSRI